MTEQEVMEVLQKTGAVVKGHFVFTSGRHGDTYINKDAVYPHTEKISRLCKALASRAMDDSPQSIEVVIAPAVGGVFLSQWVAYHLNRIAGYSHEVLAVYAEREEVSILKAGSDTLVSVGEKTISLRVGDELVVKRPAFTIKRGYDKLVEGKKVLVVEDVLTTGGSARKTAIAVRVAGGEVLGIAAICNRGGVRALDVGVTPARFWPLIDIELNSWEEDGCPLCKQGVPINTELGKGREFLARQEL